MGVGGRTEYVAYSGTMLCLAAQNLVLDLEFDRRQIVVPFQDEMKVRWSARRGAGRCVAACIARMRSAVAVR